eukprot:14687466-Ditylum_brightwellii.AAC.1
MNDQLAQFLSRDDRNPKEKIANDKIMDIFDDAMPKSWQEEIRHQRFNCMAEVQAEFICFCKNLKSLNTPRKTKGKSNTVDVSSMAKSANSCIPKRKRSENKKTS